MTKSIWPSRGKDTITILKRKIGYADQEDDVTQTQSKLAKMDIDHAGSDAEEPAIEASEQAN